MTIVILQTGEKKKSSRECLISEQKLTKGKGLRIELGHQKIEENKPTTNS